MIYGILVDKAPRLDSIAVSLFTNNETAMLSSFILHSIVILRFRRAQYEQCESAEGIILINQIFSPPSFIN